MVEFIKHINFFEWLKFYKTPEKGNFNKNYIPVDYLQSDGNQYIITPFYYDQGWPAYRYPLYNIKCKASINDNYSIFGRHQLFNLTGTSGKLRFYGYQEFQRVTTDIDTGTILNEWELRDKNLYCNGIIQNETPDYFDILGGSGVGGYIYLFCRMYDNEPDDNGGICKISNFYVSAKNPDTGTVTEICDLVACIRKSDNKPGMYDKVSQTFLTNQGTGEFTFSV